LMLRLIGYLFICSLYDHSLGCLVMSAYYIAILSFCALHQDVCDMEE
jgi:hypothetical protein